MRRIGGSLALLLLSAAAPVPLAERVTEAVNSAWRGNRRGSPRCSTGASRRGRRCRVPCPGTSAAIRRLRKHLVR
jgi:hypothetical protein